MWRGPTYQTYYQTIDRAVQSALSAEDSSYLCGVNIEQYVEFLASKFAWKPLEWDEAQITVEPFTISAKRQEAPNWPMVIVQEQRFRLRVPLSAHNKRAEYFKHGPSNTWATRSEPNWRFDENTLILEVEANERAVAEGTEAIRFWLGGRNADIKAGNTALRNVIRPLVEAEVRDLNAQREATAALLKRINIPLYQDPNARAKPIEIKARTLSVEINRPTSHTTPVRSLKPDDVIALIDFIERYGRQFEVSPKIYNRMEEEDLRDLMLGMMNVNYPGSATGETFSKLGKSDIHLRVDAGNVLICECKFWTGPKPYKENVDQLFRYLTWRQNFGVMINFCKLRNMTSAVSGARKEMGLGDQSLGANAASSDRESRFASIHPHPQDADKTIEVHHLFFDLSVRVETNYTSGVGQTRVGHG